MSQKGSFLRLPSSCSSVEGWTPSIQASEGAPSTQPVFLAPRAVLPQQRPFSILNVVIDSHPLTQKTSRHIPLPGIPTKAIKHTIPNTNQHALPMDRHHRPTRYQPTLSSSPNHRQPTKHQHHLHQPQPPAAASIIPGQPHNNLIPPSTYYHR